MSENPTEDKKLPPAIKARKTLLQFNMTPQVKKNSESKNTAKYKEKIDSAKQQEALKLAEESKIKEDQLKAKASQKKKESNKETGEKPDNFKLNKRSSFANPKAGGKDQRTVEKGGNPTPIISVNDAPVSSRKSICLREKRRSRSSISHKLKMSASKSMLTIIIGPHDETYKEKMFPIYQKRLQTVHYALVFLACLIAFLLAILQYVFLALPNFLASKRILAENLNGLPFILWTTCVVGFSIIMFEIALLQYSEESWRFLGRGRWAVPVMLNLYLLASSCYNFYELKGIPSRINSILEKDWKEMLKPALNWKGLGKSNIEHAQIYLQCCGIKSYKDWGYLEPKFRETFGSICTDVNVNLGKHRGMVCQTPLTCWGSAKHNRSHYNHRNVYQEGCLTIENNVAFGVVGIVASIEMLFFFVVIAMLAYHLTVVRSANKKGVDLQPKLFEECIQ